jgi:hypothetical protein
MAIKPIPEGYHIVSAHLAVDDAARAIAWSNATDVQDVTPEEIEECGRAAMAAVSSN